MDKKKRVQLIVLAALLIAVIAGGVLIFSRGGTVDDTPQESVQISESMAQLSSTDPTTIDPSATRYQFQLENQTEERLLEGNYYWSRYYIDHDRLVYFRAEDDESVYMTARDAVTDEVCYSYTYEDVDTPRLKQYEGHYFYEGELWELYIDDVGSHVVCRVVPGKEPEEMGQLNDYPLYYDSPKDFAVWENFVVIRGINTNSTREIMAIYDLKTGKKTVLDNVTNFCLDGEGGLYCFQGDGENKLVKYSLQTGEKLWQKDLWTDERIICQQIFYHPARGLYTLARESGKIQCRDTESGDALYTLFSAVEDTDLDFTDERFYFADFAVDADFRVCLSVIDSDYDVMPHVNIRCAWAYSPYLPKTDEADAIALTITSPYKPDAMDASVRMYQKKHPEVEITWDTQFLSREDMIAHENQYEEQLTLRLMAGDVGDILMLHGSGLDVNAVLKTDVMSDLSGYLAECPFRDELETSVIDAVRREDGSLPALPVAISPKYLIYNETLGEKMGVKLDTDEMTWGQVLALAEKWQEQGVSQSVFWTSAEDKSSDGLVLYKLLLEDLDAFTMEDGTVNLHQDWLMEELEQLKQIQESPQFYSNSTGYWWNAGDFADCLFAPWFDADYINLFSWMQLCKENNDLTLRIVPLPKGEKTGTREGYAFCWGIPEVSQNKDAAWELLEFAVSEDGFPLDIYFQETCLLNKTADRQRAEEAMQQTAKNQNTTTDDFILYYDQFRSALDHPTVRLCEPVRWSTSIYDPLEQYLDGALTLDEALTLAEKNWADVLTE